MRNQQQPSGSRSGRIPAARPLRHAQGAWGSPAEARARGSRRRQCRAGGI